MSRSDRILIAAGGSAVVLAVAAVVILLLPPMPVPGAAPSRGDDVGLLVGTPSAVPPASGPPGAAPTGTIFVDVEGAVVEPGIRELPAGSRVGDAIAAAGGYGADADLEAAAATLNLAQPLADGEQVRVPRVGEVQQVEPGPAAGGATGGAATTGGGSTGGGSTGLVNLNTATPEELEALPGIGPVTVQKIVAARQERPFASLEDAVARGVIHNGQLEDIQGVATAG
jgi:competence protein ComEA